MGFFDRLTGTKHPESGIAAQPPAQVRDALLAINGPNVPFVIRDGSPEKVDLVAEWKLVDAQWRGIFFQCGLKKSVKVLMRLDSAKNAVRSIDEERGFSWSRDGSPRFEKSYQRGQIRGRQYGRATGADGVIYEYNFSAAELKQPLQQAVTNAGWTWRGLLAGKP